MNIKSDNQMFAKIEKAKRGTLFFTGKYVIFVKYSDTTRRKAERLIINSIGQRPMKLNTHANPKPRRGVINLIISH